jgi:hypothetical protein
LAPANRLGDFVMGTLETIILILSYIKHTPDCTFINLYDFLYPDDENLTCTHRVTKTKTKGLVLGLAIDGLIDIHLSGESEYLNLTEEASEFQWGFINNTGPYVDMATSTQVALSFVHLATRTEPALQTQMTFSRKQAKQQLFQLIGALL